MAYNKYDVEMARNVRDMRRDAHFCTIVKALCKYGTIIFFIWSCQTGLADIIRGEPESLKWLYHILRKTRILYVVHMMATLILGGTATIQFYRNRYLTKKVGDMRHKLEHNDASNERSGLAPDGTAREDREV